MRASLICFFLSVLFLSANAVDPSDRIMYNGQPLFLNGANLAWVNFARDIGPGETDFEQFGKLFKETHDYGANAIRLWLHTNGWATPEFNADTVTGPGEGAIEDLIQILDSAYRYDVGLILCLWSHDMLRLEIGEPYLTQNRALLENEDVLNSYIQNALIPMVDSTKNHPGIIAWEVFNEPEGMIAGVSEGGWGSHGHVERNEISRAVNRIAGAIHRVDPDLKVTNGTHTLTSNSDRGEHNYYSDSALYNRGGDPDGYLDFYQVHYYDFLLNPFEHNYSFWNLDKPLILGEFHPGCNNCGDFSNYETLLDSGYAGALGWMWLDQYGEIIKEEVQNTFLNHTDEVDIDNMLGDTPFLSFSGPEYGEVFDTGSDIAFMTEAYDTDGTVDTVKYFLVKEVASDSVLITLTEAPYNYTWVSPPDGLYKVYVQALDNDGFSKTSKIIAFTVGDPPRYRYEAEEAILNGGSTVVSDASASGGQYVNFTSDASILWNVFACPANGTYDMIIGYGVPFGEKNNYFTINGDTLNKLDLHFNGPSDQWLFDTIQVDLTEGTNTIEATDFWGWMTFDFLEFPFQKPPLVTDINISTASGNFYIDEPEGTLQMLATLLPEEAASTGVRWTLNNPAIASIEEFSGLLTAKKDGVVKVFAWSLDGSGITDNVEITLSNQPVGLSPMLSDNSEIFPNPAHEELFFTSGSDIILVSVYNLQGQMILSFIPERNTHSIDIADLAEGLYILNIQMINGDVESHKFIKHE